MRYIITQKTIYIIGMLSILQSSITVCAESFDITRARYITRRLNDYQDWLEELAQSREDEGLAPHAQHESHADLKSRASVSELQRACNIGYEKQLNQVCTSRLETILPEAVLKLIMEYAKQEWRLNRKFKIHEGAVLRLIAAGDNLIASAEFNTKEQDLPLRFWDMGSGETRGTSSDNNGYRRTVPPELSITAMRNLAFSLVDFDAQDKLIASVNSKTITVLPLGLPYLQAIATKKLLYHKAHSITIDNESYEPGIISVKFPLCSHYLLTGSLDGTVSIVDLTTEDKAYTLHHDHPVTSLVQSSDGGTLLVGLANGEVYSWGGVSITHHLSPTYNKSLMNTIIAENPTQMLMIDKEEEADQLARGNNNIIGNDSDLLCLQNFIDCGEIRRESYELCKKCCRTGCSCIRTLPTCLKLCGCCCFESCKTCCYNPIRTRCLRLCP